MEAFLRYTDTEPGEISEDGNFTVIEAECLAACGFPTCVQINSRYFENVTPADVPQIIEHLKAETAG
jgi:NADH:ubiquinone oxidoreductase subunit E